jgi:3-oxoacyl-[acyl-carrier protein] reductase
MPNNSSKIALITGASRKIGIGAAIARALAESGTDIFLAYYHAYDEQMPWGSHPDEVETLLAHLQQQGVRAAGCNLDLAQAEAPFQLFETAEQALGPVDILINNAAYSVNDGIDSLTAETLDRHYAVNVRAMALLCVEFTRRFGKQHGGRIINITSGQSLGPMPGELAYVASKGAVDAFTVSLANGVMEHGITVNAVDPGGTDTGWMSDEFKAELVRQSPAGRVGLPEDAARLICWLATDEARWITGQILRSRGGM